MRRQIRIKYIIAILVATTLLIFNQAFIQYWLNQKHDDAKVINMAGRQRMLSQKINLELYRALYADSSAKLLANTYWQQWNDAHLALMYGDQELNIEPASEPEVIDLLKKITANINYVKGEMNKPELTQDMLEGLYKNQADFLTNMEDVVGYLEASSDRKLNFIIRTEIILGILSVVVILFEILFVFRPISSRMMEQLTKLTKTTETLKGISENSVESICVMDEKQQLVYRNSAAEKLCDRFGITKPTEFEFGEGNKEEGRKFFDKKYNRVLEGFVEQFEREWKDDKYLFLMFPQRSSNNKIVGVVTIIQDITTLKSQEALIEDQIERFNQIAWEHAHEVRRPLTNVLLYSNMLFELKREQLDEEGEKFVTFINDEARALDSVIKNIIEKTDFIARFKSSERRRKGR
tara:strand:+ start:356 stop:1576 length:1221 start_codon:yes stop_codon:yes gene_type:complete